MIPTRAQISTHRWFTGFCLLCIGLCVLLGTWQYQRLQWKTAIIDQIVTQSALPAIPLEQALEDNQPYRKVLLSGTLLHDNALHVAGKYMKGQLGYHVITPLQLKSGDIVLVNQGWIDAKKKDQDLTKPLPQGAEGFIRAFRDDVAWFIPEHQPADNLWFWYDINAMAAHLQAQNINAQAVFIQQMTPNAENNPHVQEYDALLNVRNDHLEYLITWFSLALIIIVMWSIYVRR